MDPAEPVISSDPVPNPAENQDQDDTTGIRDEKQGDSDTLPSIGSVDNSTDGDTDTTKNTGDNDKDENGSDDDEDAPQSDAVERFITDGETDFSTRYDSEIVQNHKPEVRDTSTETTWDYSLFADSNDEQKKGKTIWITDTNFLSKLEGYDSFGKCEHEIIKLQCPCEEQNTFPICTKCHRVFCSNKCFKYVKDNQSGQVKKNQPSSSMGVQSKTSSDNDQETTGSPPKYNSNNSARNGPKMPNSITNPERWSALSEEDALDAFLNAPPPMPAFMPRSHRHPMRQPWNNRNPNYPIRPTINNPVQQNPRMFNNASNGPRLRSSSGFDQTRFPIPQKPFYDQQSRFTSPPMPQRPPLFNKMGSSSAGPPSAQQNTNYPLNQRMPMPNYNQQKIVSQDVRLQGLGDPHLQKKSDPVITRGYGSSNHEVTATTSTSPGRGTSSIPNMNNVELGLAAGWDHRFSRPQISQHWENSVVNNSKEKETHVKILRDPWQRSDGNSSSNNSHQPIVKRPNAFTFGGSSNNENVAVRKPEEMEDVMTDEKIRQSLSRGVGRGGFSPKISESSDNTDVPNSITNVIKETPSATTVQESRINVQQNSPRDLKHVDSPKPYSSRNAAHHHQSPPEKPVSFSRKPTTTTTGYEKPEEKPHKSTFRKQPSNNSKTFHPPEQGPHRILPIAEKPFVAFGVPMQVGYSFGDSLDDFYVWTGLGFVDNQNIQTIIDDVDDFPIMQKPVVGKYCIAKYTNPEVSQIDGWYRARIVGVQGEHVKVFFIDYGNEEIVHQDSIGSLTANLLRFRPSAIRLAIGDLVQFEQCDDFLGNIFDEYVIDKWIRVTIYEEHASESEMPDNLPQKYPAVLEICSDGKWVSIAEILQKKKLGRRVPLWKNVFKPQEYLSDDFPALSAVHQEYEVFLRHVKTINEFYVTPKDLISKRTSIMNALNIREFSDYPIDSWLETNYVCIARRQGEWARAKITEMSRAGVVEIRFIDFGETTKVNMDQLKSIPLQLLSEPQLAYRCSLPVFPVSGQHPESLQLIQTLIEKGHPVSLVVFALEMELSTHIVEVYFEKKSEGLTTLLLKEHKDSFIEGYEVDLDIRTKLSKKKSLVNPVVSSQNVMKSMEGDVKKSSDVRIMNQKTAHEMQNNAANFPVTVTAPKSSAKMPSSSSVELLSVFSLPPSPLLSTLLNTDVTISHVVSFNRIFIKLQSQYDTFMELQDEIIDCVDSDDAFETPPPVDSLVVAPFDDKNHCRAVVKQYFQTGKVEVQFIDFGSCAIIDVIKLKPPSPQLSQIFQLAYEVKLRGINDNPSLLLKSDFDTFMTKAVKVKYTLESCSLEDGESLINLVMKTSRKSQLSDMILQKGIWEWEKHFEKGFTSDGELFLNNDKWSAPAKIEDVLPCSLPKGEKLQGEIGRSTSEGDLFIFNINDAGMERNMRVLQNQIARYAEKITPDPFFPMLKEVILIFLKDVPELREMNLKGLGKWNRCWRESAEYYRNLDYDETYPIRSDKSEHLEIRRIYPEFLRIPIGMAECCINNFKPSPEAIKRLKETCQPGKTIVFSVDEYDENDFIFRIQVDFAQ